MEAFFGLSWRWEMYKKILFFTFFLAFSPFILSAEPSQKAENEGFYRVKNGDCLWNISKHLWKNPKKWPLLYMANQDRISNPNLIYPGQEFTLPSAAQLANADLKEATRLAYAKLGHLPTRGAKPKPVRGMVERPGSDLSKSAAVKEAASDNEKSPQKAVNPPMTAEEKPVSEVPVTATGGSGQYIMIVAVLLALIVGMGIWMWRKMGRVTTPAIQEPKPLSSFPEAQKQPPMRSATITSVSMPTTPSSSQLPTTELQSAAKPESPANQPSSAPPEAPSPSLASNPPAQTPPGDKPSDSPPPPASSNHAA